MAVGKAEEAELAAKFAVMRPFLSERGWRVYLGTEANQLGHGGIAAVARASGASKTTVAAGAAEARDPKALAELPPGGSRQAGAGRPRAEGAQPGLRQELDGLLEEGRRGDPVSALTWSILSLRDIARQMALRGFPVSKDTVARLMRDDGYSLRGMAKVVEGRQHEDRDLQFGNINAEIARAVEDGEPVVSVDGKKKELLGAYGRNGTAWRPRGEPVRVLSHDFKGRDTVTAVPYGVYDIAANRGFVSIGTSHDTAAFAVNAIRLWWRREGSLRYPRATRLLVACDAGGANDHRSHQWKDQLARLAEETGLRVEVMHFPPGTSKWNKIEHRLFCHITRTWRARPLMTVDDAVAGIAATVTAQGLKCTAVRDDGDYPTGLKVPPARVRDLEDRHVERGAFHGEWNYALLPAPRPAESAPEPEPGPVGPDPALVAGLAALAGITDLRELHARSALDQAAAREHRLALERGRTSRAPGSPGGYRGSGGYGRLSGEAVLAAAACRVRLRMTWSLLGRLLGVDPSSVRVPAAAVIPVLERHGIAPGPGGPRIATPAGLLAHAAAVGVALAIPGTALTQTQTRQDE